MLNPFLFVPVQGSTITKLDAVRSNSEAFQTGTKTVTDNAFGALGEQVTTIPTITTLTQENVTPSVIEEAKRVDGEYIFSGRAVALSTSKIKLVREVA